VFPTGAALPLSPFTESLENPSVGGIVLLVGALTVGWLVSRNRLVARRPTTAEERLAGLATALACVAVVAVVLAAAKPYALVFVLPSLYAWLWLPIERRLWQRVAMFVVGLAGPVLGLVLLANELALSIPRATLYALGLVTVGYVPLSSALLGLVWLAAAAQVAAIAFGRYAPYADGAEPPPPGAIRSLVGRRS
jgi:hypothetical protein